MYSSRGISSPFLFLFSRRGGRGSKNLNFLLLTAGTSLPHLILSLCRQRIPDMDAESIPRLISPSLPSPLSYDIHLLILAAKFDKRRMSAQSSLFLSPMMQNEEKKRIHRQEMGILSLSYVKGSADGERKFAFSLEFDACTLLPETKGRGGYAARLPGIQSNPHRVIHDQREK